MADIVLTPAVLNYRITAGDDFADTVTIKEGEPSAAVDVSARTFTAQVRRPRGDARGDGTAIQMVIATGSAASGIIGYSLADTVTDDMSGTYVWDFQQSVGGAVRTLMGGTFSVIGDVTRA